MRTSDAGEVWVARAGEIIGGLSLTPVPDGQWLTGLLVAPDWRGKGVARLLIDHACGAERTWLFCHPDLQGFYERLGFMVNEDLPQTLADRLARYRRSKPLLAMVRDQSSAAGSSPGNSTSV
ncbi:GNAT family N-acetyltransferase [Pseudomonas putida]|nr:GNAT family N-acetyltransferase [Pseudomonas putida]